MLGFIIINVLILLCLNNKQLSCQNWNSVFFRKIIHRVSWCNWFVYSVLDVWVERVYIQSVWMGGYELSYHYDKVQGYETFFAEKGCRKALHFLLISSLCGSNVAI